MSDKYYWMWREEKKKHESEVKALKTQLHTERETIKKEADELMMKKISKYENAIAFSRKRIKELENSLSIALENISDNQLKTK